jgi:hypothetical protein
LTVFWAIVPVVNPIRSLVSSFVKADFCDVPPLYDAPLFCDALLLCGDLIFYGDLLLYGDLPRDAPQLGDALLLCGVLPLATLFLSAMLLCWRRSSSFFVAFFLRAIFFFLTTLPFGFLGFFFSSSRVAVTMLLF